MDAADFSSLAHIASSCIEQLKVSMCDSVEELRQLLAVDWLLQRDMGVLVPSPLPTGCRHPSA